MAPRPRITISYAQSLDGRIATADGESQWISGPETLQLSQELRRDNQAILVGIGTVLRDDPLLTCRLPGCLSPLRVVLDSALRLPSGAKVTTTTRDAATLVLTTAGDGDRMKELRSLGAEVETVGRGDDGRVSLVGALDVLTRRGVESVYVEGGAAVITAFIRGGLVDRLLVVTAPVLIGAGVEAVGDLGVRRLADALRPRVVSLERRGDDMVWELAFDV